LLFVVAVAVALSMAIESKRGIVSFEEFETMYHKTYASSHERLMRRYIYADNMRKAEQLNIQNPRATYGSSPFADLSSEEFAATHLMPPVSASDLAKPCLQDGVYLPAPPPSTLPDSFDWRNTAGVVQSVKDQGSCGSCWAFSTVQNIEGVMGKAGMPVELSAQYITDCSKGCSTETIDGVNTTVCNHACSGGWPWTALNDVATGAIGPVPGWTEYPYKGVYQACKTGNWSIQAKISGYTCLGLDNGGNEDAIAQNLMDMGPLSISLNADHFQTYRNGIMDPVFCDTEILNHAVLLVGFGVDKDILRDDPYWIVKNSWGTSWGEDGYVRIYRGKGVCGINEAVACALL